jgi:hypothetical protein
MMFRLVTRYIFSLKITSGMIVNKKRLAQSLSIKNMQCNGNHCVYKYTLGTFLNLILTYFWFGPMLCTVWIDHSLFDSPREILGLRMNSQGWRLGQLVQRMCFTWNTLKAHNYTRPSGECHIAGNWTISVNWSTALTLISYDDGVVTMAMVIKVHSIWQLIHDYMIWLLSYSVCLVNATDILIPRITVWNPSSCTSNLQHKCRGSLRSCNKIHIYFLLSSDMTNANVTKYTW